MTTTNTKPGALALDDLRALIDNYVADNIAAHDSIRTLRARCEVLERAAKVALAYIQSNDCGRTEMLGDIEVPSAEWIRAEAALSAALAQDGGREVKP